MAKEKAEKTLSKELAAIEKAAQAAYGLDQAAGNPSARPDTSRMVTSLNSDGTKRAYREYRPPEPEEGGEEQEALTPQESAQKLIAFYNQKFRNATSSSSDQIPEPIKAFTTGTQGWGRYSEDKKYYRAVIIKVKPDPEKKNTEYEDNNKYTVRYSDYGNEEDLRREDFTTEEPALWMKPPEPAKVDPEEAAKAAEAAAAAAAAEAEKVGVPGGWSSVSAGEGGGEAAAAAAAEAEKVGVPGGWSSVSAGEGAWGSNERKYKEVEKMNKKKRKLLAHSRADKYSGGDATVGYGNFHQEIDANDYGLNDDGSKAESAAATISSSDAAAKPKVGFKKRGKKKRQRNIRGSGTS
eukprot:CAMPEP_0197541716 /NCGR_PEP_ID=MMETSP1318-20131121/67311_1 /TAXON_ID=552666 /ORGANISM="Partenskyella glossopodia, Strain RCC365" /LENGTH=350 /DNA_ID=CAMNT_0043100917 /DNA_START=283 /DNA_END=1339 /DNA_ORIENTATION=+